MEVHFCNVAIEVYFKRFVRAKHQLASPQTATNSIQIAHSMHEIIRIKTELNVSQINQISR